MKKYLFLIFIVSLLAFTFTGNPPSGWYQQFIPDLGGMPISDMEFLDSLTGFIITGDTSPDDTNYVLKTTNGGDNWFINYKDFKNFSRIIFITDSIGYICGSSFQINGALYKTTNQGANWIAQNTPFGMNYDDMSIVNEDTIWVVDNNSFDGGVFRTTNGGLNWANQYFNAGTTPSGIYMINGNEGFFSTGNKLFKTNNSGINWDSVSNENGFNKMYFIDSLTGWKTHGPMKKTTNGGTTWVTQPIPSGGMFLSSAMTDFKNIDKDTIYGTGGIIRFGPGNNRALIWKTTNGGINWGYQIPDTTIHLFQYFHIDLSDEKHIWAYAVNSGIHTNIGGDTTIYVGVSQISNEVPDDFELYQNYPNPFNPTTSIKFKVKSTTNVKLNIYDITGRELAVLVNEKLSAGEYEYKFDGSKLTSGAYFYKLETGLISEVKKMVLLK